MTLALAGVLATGCGSSFEGEPDTSSSGSGGASSGTGGHSGADTVSAAGAELKPQCKPGTTGGIPGLPPCQCQNGSTPPIAPACDNEGNPQSCALACGESPACTPGVQESCSCIVLHDWIGKHTCDTEGNWARCTNPNQECTLPPS